MTSEVMEGGTPKALPLAGRGSKTQSPYPRTASKVIVMSRLRTGRPRS